MSNDPRGQQVQRRDAEIPPLLSIFVNGATNFAKKNKGITGSYFLGLLLLLFATGFKVTDDMRAAYDSKLGQIDDSAKQAAWTKLRRAEERHYHSKGFFSCDANCQNAKRELDAARYQYDVQVRAENDAVSDAKAQVGIMSEYGVQETRDMFWGVFAGGKDFAKRSSMWDLIFMGWRWGRDETLVTVVLRWLMQLLMNFTLGLIGALFVFVWRLWGLIAAYQPDPFTAVMYFGAAALSATVCVLSYLAIMYAAAAGTVGVVGKALVDHGKRWVMEMIVI